MSTVSEPVAGEITKELKRMMRESDTVSFHWTGKVGPMQQQQPGAMRLCRKEREVKGWTRAEENFSVPVPAKIYCYGYAGLPRIPHGAEVQCRSVKLHACTDEIWTTFVASIREGDILSMKWIADNSNQYTQEAGLHVDELHICVARGKSTLEFALDFTICPNNTARMIRVI